MQFFAYNLSGKHFNPTSCGVIRDQRSKIHSIKYNDNFNCRVPFLKNLEIRVYTIITTRNPHRTESPPESHASVGIQDSGIPGTKERNPHQIGCMQNTFARVECDALGLKVGQARRTTIGHLVYKQIGSRALNFLATRAYIDGLLSS